MTAGLVGTSGFAAIPTTALDLPLVQRLRRSPRFRVRVPKSIVSTIAASLKNGAAEKGNSLLIAKPPMADASLNRRQTIRLGADMAFAQIGTWASMGRSSSRRSECSGCRRQHQVLFAQVFAVTISDSFRGGGTRRHGALRSAWIMRWVEPQLCMGTPGPPRTGHPTQ